jgi:hypothetical protein
VVACFLNDCTPKHFRSLGSDSKNPGLWCVTRKFFTVQVGGKGVSETSVKFCHTLSDMYVF